MKTLLTMTLSIVIALLVFPVIGFAMPSVSGNTLTWVDDGWYQVQRADTYETVCSGSMAETSSLSGGPCVIDTKEHIVINHATGERFNNISAESTSSSVTSVVVSGNTISWPDDGWYQVQHADTFDTVCNGGLNCTVEPGRYVVINHSTKERFNNIEVGDGITDSGSTEPMSIVIEGNTIRWPDDGWYQIQNTQDYASVCEGGTECVVSSGNYVVINHTSGERTTLDVPSEPIASDISADVPTDCLLDTAVSGELFCYSKDTRTLRAWTADGNAWWSFVLPGTDDLNEPHAIQVIDGELVILAENKQGTEQLGFEISLFSLNGEFQRTTAIQSMFRPESRQRVWGRSIDVEEIGSLLVVAGEYGGLYDSELEPADRGAFLAFYDTSSGGLRTSSRYSQRNKTGSLEVDGTSVLLELDGIPFKLSSTSLQLQSATNEYQSISFNEDNYLAQKNRIIAMVENPPFDAIANRMHNWFFSSLDRRGTRFVDVVACPISGTVSHGYYEASTEVQRTISFENCVANNFTANGMFRTRSGNFCGRDCSGPYEELSFENFSVSFNDGESWQIDGSVSTSEQRVNFSGVVSPTTTEKSTVLNVFSRTDARGTLTLQALEFDSFRRQEQGDASWSGSGSMIYADGTSEEYAVNARRVYNNNIQSEFSGNLMASRSDGTSLSVNAVPGDSEKILYTITNIDINRESVDNW